MFLMEGKLLGVVHPAIAVRKLEYSLPHRQRLRPEFTVEPS